jgi:hypothetical protein
MQSLYTRLVKNTRPKYGSKTDKIPTFWIPEFIIPAHLTNLMKSDTRSGLMERITTMQSMAETGRCARISALASRTTSLSPTQPICVPFGLINY